MLLYIYIYIQVIHYDRLVFENSERHHLTACISQNCINIYIYICACAVLGHSSSNWFPYPHPTPEGSGNSTVHGYLTSNPRRNTRWWTSCTWIFHLGGMGFSQRSRKLLQTLFLHVFAISSSQNIYELRKIRSSHQWSLGDNGLWSHGDSWNIVA